jgi:membrane-associated protein
MLSTGLLAALIGKPGLMALLTHHWLLGMLAVAGVVFLETALVVMPFLPGDSLLFATGALLGITGTAPLAAVAIVTAAAVLGDTVNYRIGRSAWGRQLVRRGRIKPSHLAQARAWFDRWGAPTITLGRFVPVVRSVAPFVAGLTGMCARRFAVYNLLGALLWCGGMMLAGSWMGSIGWVRAHLALLPAGVVALSLLTLALHLARRRRPA